MDKDFFEYKNNFMRFKNMKSNLILEGHKSEIVLFTIAIPTYKRPELLIKALKSAIKQVGIKKDEYEIIIVDNDPDELYISNELTEVIQSNENSNIFYYRNEENIGMFGNWNRAIELSRGKYITILNDDDWLSEDYLYNCKINLSDKVDGLFFPSNCMDLREKNTKQKVNNKVILKCIKKIARNRKKLILFDFLLGNQSQGTLGVLFNREKLISLGGYNPDYFPSSDFVLHANYCSKYDCYLVKNKLNFYRIAENESAKQETLKKWELIDNEIRHYFIDIIGKHKKILHYIAILKQENRIEGMIKTWGYETDYRMKHSIGRPLFRYFVLCKNLLNL